MGLTKVKKGSNMYQFITHTWNPLGGECEHKCSYCYVESMKERFSIIEDKYSGKPRVIEKELKTNLGKGKFIFVCSLNDLFQNNNSLKHVIDVLSVCGKYKDNQYFFQTKNPKAFNSIFGTHHDMFSDYHFCITLETNRYYKEMENCVHPVDRYLNFKNHSYKNKYITIEPIMDFDLKPFVEMIKSCEPLQVNVGADSGNNNLIEPPKDKILELINELEKFTIVNQKSNLDRLLK